MTKSIIKTVFRKEWIYGLIYGFLSFFSYCLLSFSVCDRNRLYQDYGGKEFINGHDQEVINCIGVFEITKQSYLFLLFFIFLITIFFFILWAYLSYKTHRADISLLIIRGSTKIESQYTFLFARGMLFLIVSLISIIPCIIFIFTFFFITGTQHIIVHFTPWIFLLILVALSLFLIISLPFFKTPFKKERLIQFLRENY